MRLLRSRLAVDPANPGLAVELARRYIDLGRSEADPRYQGYAQAALSPWWSDEKPPLDVLLLLRAMLRQSRHDFGGALADLAQVLDRDPRNAQAWLTRAVILRVTGDYAEGRRSCARLVRLAEPLVGTACIAAIASLTGEGERSYRLLLQQLEQVQDIDDAERLWVLTLLAEMAARLDRSPAADAHFRDALSLGIRDPYLLAAYADFLLDEGRPSEALRLVKNETRIDGLVLRRVLAERSLDGASPDAGVRDLQARFEAGHRRADTVHRREEAWFTLKLLNEPKRALGIAMENWAVQREPTDARIALEAGLAAHDYSTVEPVVRWLEENRLEDIRIKPLIARFKEVRP